ncbi:hypothetical protein [Prauserella flavalba]|uniref:hypothetical protein n=1 Tax=Prauserella flavalba TaxID=1477506 RepID=UPI0036E9ED9D
MLSQDVVQPVALVPGLGDEVRLHQPPEPAADVGDRHVEPGGERLGGELDAGMLGQTAVEPGGGGV